MKKIVSFLMCLAVIFACMSLVSCSGELSIGVGAYAAVSKTTSASATAAGQGEVGYTVCAVLVDNSGKIVSAKFDSVDALVKYTNTGKFVVADEYKSKYELGDDYNMVEYGGAKSEWYKQADIFASLVVGKTVEEVKALVAEDKKGNSDVISAGCTITVSEFALALENAMKSLKVCGASESDTLKLSVISVKDSSKCKDAKSAENGKAAVETTFIATALKDGKIIAAMTDAISVEFLFDSKGQARSNATSMSLASKRSLGDSYGMKAYGGAALEWYEQANAFDEALVGKDKSGVAALVTDAGKGTEALIAAGCTVTVSDFVKAAAKAFN